LRRNRILLTASLGLVFALRALPAQQGAGPAAGPSRSAPPVPSDPALAEVARAIRDARKEYESAKAQSDKEAQEQGSKISEESQAVAALIEEEKKLKEKLEKLDAETRVIDEKLSTTLEAHGRATETIKAVEAELLSQAEAFSERFAGTLVAAENPKVLEVPGEVQKKGTPLGDRIAALLDAYDKVLVKAGTAAIVELPVLTSGAGAKVEKLRVLRVGFLGGYYARAAGREGGFVLSDSASRTGFVAESQGLRRDEQESIALFVLKPELGGKLPMDLSGGVGLASLQIREAPLRWFERGGAFMWPLLGLAALALLFILERTLALSIKSLSVHRAVGQVLALVRNGRVEAAEATCARLGGAAGDVFHSALEHRNDGRSTLEAAVQAALLRQTPPFEARLGFISLCAALAPLLGLLGTVNASFGLFRALSILGFNDPRFLTGGVSEALITAEFGLMIAIPCILFRGLLGSLAERALGKLEAGALALIIALLKLRESVLSPLGPPEGTVSPLAILPKETGERV
jgi:biopolymer transport protein ExbB